MSKIELMKPELANLIAAGEVIERPASVIKELVENSIDAGAKNIFVGVSEAGKGSILVKDDGSGMDREDAQACFLRHASSKIKTEYDLSRIHTLGFRGEAIPSIAAVSKVILTTSDGNGAGTRVEANPNEDLAVFDAVARKGTVFEVKNLFFNTPARLKYLKSEQSETYAIVETVEHLALGFPEISFSLALDGKEVFRTSGRGDLLETIQKIYGNDIAQSLYPVKKEGVAYSFSGFVSKPEVSYSKRYNLLTFLNKRCIYDYKINKAIEDAYRDYLPPLRYPFAILDLSLDYSLVDVNVHPTKKEVRISMEEEIARDVKDEILKTLKEKRPLYAAGEDSKTQKDLKIDEGAIDVEDLKADEEKKIETSYQDVKPLPSTPRPSEFQDSLPFEPTYESHGLRTPDAVKTEEKPEASYQGEDYYRTIFQKEGISAKLPEMHPIGQVLHTYIVCDGGDCFYLIDQHAAAERINFEKTEALFASIRSRVVPLFPLTLELSYKEKQNYDEEHQARLLSLGIVTEPFGEKTIKVTEIPSFLTEADDGAILVDSIHSCLNDDVSDPLDLLHLTIANIACKKSIKANHLMSEAEVEGLLSDLAKCKNPANCPHGRPTLIKISKDDIEKIFRRSGF
jgi:DNA mismatch repair protein MutL